LSKLRNHKIGSVITIVILLCVVITITPQTTARIVLIDTNKGFNPSAVTYTNKTFHFQDSDPYTYSYWQYEIGTVTNTQNTNEYRIDTDVNGEYAYFGFDEFVNKSVVSAQVQFETTLMAGTGHFQPLGYFYQKTNLESTTRWALVLNWDSSGLDLYYNTGNGDTPASHHLNDTAPYIGDDFIFKLSNLGDQTYVYVEDITGDRDIIYNGYVTTEVYDATSLYAGFGQWCSASGNFYGNWDDFVIIDSHFEYPDDGSDFNRIDAYVNEAFAQTLYDQDEGYNTILTIDEAVTNLTFSVECWLNSTTYGISTIQEGKNIIRHTISVISTNKTVVFSQTNLTYVEGIDYGDDVFLYRFSIELDFTITAGNIYTVTLSYEVFDWG